ncbi:MAG: N-acetylglucosamine-specific PTS transporter subunit IIBC [Defluviitaleaceae bacterium]|nr:N-acetylglucosamine-specific PTS transporter subunit IIBC [Defluviitaleaceae bacterium]
MFKYLQSIGKALMMPIAVLPAAALLMGIGYWIDPVGWGGESALAAFLITAGAAIIDNMSLLFAVGVAYGLAKDNNGSAALSGLVAFMVITSLLSPGTVSSLFGRELSASEYLAFERIANQFIGILSGVVAAMAYNRFSKTELPNFLAFFSGRRLVPIVTAGAMVVVSGVFLFVWPIMFAGLVSFGTTIAGLGAFGAGLYGFFNRLLIPIGLHHPLNSVFWFDLVSINDLGNFWGGPDGGGVIGQTGMYMAGFFPVMMFGLPGACLAMYRCARPENRKKVYGIMVAAAFASFFTGITEPIEFSFIFVAPLLLLVHATLTGISMIIAASMQWFAGFGFSAGLVDLVLSTAVPFATGWYMLIALGIVYFFVYYFVFSFFIKKFNLQTPGREIEDTQSEMELELETGDWHTMAVGFIEGLGGKENITSIDNCSTRLRLSVKDTTLISDSELKKFGAFGIVKPSKTEAQVVVGPKVQFVADEIKKML